MDLYDPVTGLTGVGRVMAGHLADLGIHTIYDLLSHFPRGYEDRTTLRPIAELEVGEPACFRAFVVRDPRTSHIRKGLDLTKVTVADHSGKLQLVFFNQSFQIDRLRYGREYIFYGTVEGDYRACQVSNPAFEAPDSPPVVTRCILPLYPLTAGVTNRFLVKLIAQALEVCRGSLPELLPEDVRAQYDLCGVEEAYRTVHRPPSFEALARARRRLIFEEFFVFSIGLGLMRERRAECPRPPYRDCDLAPFLAALPFEPTSAQTRAIGEIAADLRGDRPMNRLVQGDVGSGKTVIAAAAAYLAAKNGRQTALMAPTELLAEQHYRSLRPLFERFGFETVLLTGSLGAAAKREAKAAIAEGRAQLVIGTHALLTGDVTFSSLDLVIADEQHRFGVAQRSALAAKADRPHMLVMSATPIPRTLSLILYGDLDLSIVDELPPGRQRVDTFLIPESYRDRLNGFIRRQAEAGHQVYIVCPAVEESEDGSLKSAEAWAGTLGELVFPDLSVGLLHGRMRPADKDYVMARFLSGEIQILVATTVVEVGVDVPNATLMVIENADRFGLSQLHQLRGRVGRGEAKSWCILLSDNRNSDTRARLKAFCQTNDGFEIAQRDLELRGPGDFFGQRQHGLPDFKVASLQCDLDTLQEAQSAAASALPALDLAPLLPRLRSLFQTTAPSFN